MLCDAPATASTSWSNDSTTRRRMVTAEVTGQAVALHRLAQSLRCQSTIPPCRRSARQQGKNQGLVPNLSLGPQTTADIREQETNADRRIQRCAEKSDFAQPLVSRAESRDAKVFPTGSGLLQRAVETIFERSRTCPEECRQPRSELQNGVSGGAPLTGGFDSPARSP